jgi:hypothetical protein
LVRPEILTVVGGAQSGGKIERGRDSIIERGRDSIVDSFSTPDDKGLISIDSMGHSATIPAITKLEDALEYIEGVDNGEGGISGSVGSNDSSYYNITKPIFDWIDSNNMEYNIRSMGEILSNRSDLAMQISIEDIVSWNSLAADIINENIPQSSNECDLMHIDYDEVPQNMAQVRNSSVNEFIVA